MSTIQADSDSARGGNGALLAIGVVAALFVALLFGAGSDPATIILILVLIAGITWLGRRLTTDADPWLATVIVLGFAVKLLGASARYLALIHVFGGGDATGYHTFASNMAPVLRDFGLDTVLGGFGNKGFGTNVTKVAFTFLYIPYIPSAYGGFVEAATFSFLGQIGFYTAFRRWMPSDRLKPYALLLFFLPTLLFWPSSVGKDALMVGGLGLAAAGFSAAQAHYRLRNLVAAVIPLALATLVRPHVSMLLLGSVFAAMALGRRPRELGTSFGRVVLVALITVGLLIGAPRAAQLIDVELSAGGVEALIERQRTQTSQGGSVVQGSAATSIGQLPSATLRVLFRPLPHEARSLEMLASSAEGAFLLLLTIGLLPRMVRRLRKGIRNTWVLTASVYTVGFIVAFSTVLNLGIMARQRAQLLPMFLALIVALGWRGDDLEPRRGRGGNRQETRSDLTESVGG